MFTKKSKKSRYAKKKLVFLALTLTVLFTACESSPNGSGNISANNYIANGQYSDAVLEFKKALEKDPENYEAYEGLANIYIALNNETTREGLKHTVQAYYSVMPGDERLMDYVLEYAEGLEPAAAFYIASDVYDTGHSEKAYSKIGDICAAIYENTDYLKAYNKLISDYFKAFDEGITYMEAEERYPNVTIPFMGETDSSQLYYWLNDYDKNGIPELIIGNTAEYRPNGQNVLGIYTFSDGKIVQLAAGSDTHFAVYPADNDRIYRSYFERSIEVNISYLEGTELRLKERVYSVYDEPHEFWYHSIDGGEDQSITEEEARDILDKMDASVIKMDWEKASAYNGQKTELVIKWVLGEEPPEHLPDEQKEPGELQERSAVTNAEQVLETLRDTALMNKLTDADRNIGGGIPHFFVQDMNSDGKLEIYVLAGGDIRDHASSMNYIITFGNNGPESYSLLGDGFDGCNVKKGIFANHYFGMGYGTTIISQLNTDGTVVEAASVQTNFGNYPQSGQEEHAAADGLIYGITANGSTEYFKDSDSLAAREKEIMAEYELSYDGIPVLSYDGIPVQTNEYGYSSCGYELIEENFETAVQAGISAASSNK